MENNFSLSALQGDTLEVHYWFGDDTHTMDANVQNKCEYEILGIIKEIANIFSIEITIETEPDGSGGLKKWLKILVKEEDKKASLTATFIVAFATLLIFTPLTKITEKFIDNLFEDKEMIELQKQKLRLEIERLQNERSSEISTASHSSLIKKRKSNLYDTLKKYPKISKVSFSAVNDSKTKVTKEKFILKEDFDKFILVSDDLKPIDIDNAIIEIIAPVLKKGSYKWIGYYDGIPVDFNMKSEEFKSLVQNKEVEFKNGSSINCHLRIKRKINNEGLEIRTGYDVLRVNHYFENDTPIETKEGKHHRQVKEAEKNQLKLFPDTSRNEQ